MIRLLAFTGRERAPLLEGGSTRDWTRYSPPREKPTWYTTLAPILFIYRQHMIIDTTIKLGAIPWTVKSRDKEWSDTAGALANCVVDDHIINVSTEGRSPQEIARLFIHELLHAIWYEYDLGKRPSEEKAVTQFATGLAAFLAHNPKMAVGILQNLAA